MTGQLEGKRLVVTGAAQGLGAATVRALCGAGAHVVALDVREGPAELLPRLTYLRCDVTDREQIDAAFARAAGQMGGIDGLAHAAGIERSMPAREIDDLHWETILNVNTRGTMLANQAAYRHMRGSGGGRIVNFGSIAGVTGQPGGAAYSASKGAVLAWSRAVAKEWGCDGITVNCVAPIIWSPMYERFRAELSPEDLAARDAVRAATIPLGPQFGDADRDLGPVMVFLMSDASRFITGQTLPVDGGALILT